MSLPALNKIFKVLRVKCPNLPDSLCPHVMRHTWNDRFSEEMDKRQIPEETEKKWRSYLKNELPEEGETVRCVESPQFCKWH